MKDGEVEATSVEAQGVQVVQVPDMVAALMSEEVETEEGMGPGVEEAWELVVQVAVIASQDVTVGTATAPATLMSLRSLIQVGCVEFIGFLTCQLGMKAYETVLMMHH